MPWSYINTVNAVSIHYYENTINYVKTSIKTDKHKNVKDKIENKNVDYNMDDDNIIILKYKNTRKYNDRNIIKLLNIII